MKSNILISGSHGFIGTALIKSLAKKHNVYIIVRELLDDPTALTEYIRKINPEYIYHLASYGNHSFQDKDMDTIATNTIKTFLLLNSLKDSGVQLKGFINFSSSSVYGKSAHVMTENSPTIPLTMYGATKLATEHIARVFAQKYHIPLVTVRPFSVYGEGEASFRFIPTVISRIRDGEPLTLDPLPVHDWIYIDDFVDAVGIVVKNIGKLQGKSVNIGSGKEYRNLKVVYELETISGKDAKINKVTGLRDYDTKTSWKSRNDTLIKLGWKPKYSLKQGLRKTYENTK